MNLFMEKMRAVTRRQFLQRCQGGIGAAALATLLSRDLQGATISGQPMAPKASHYAPRAKRVICMHMAGSPPQQDLFDYKPKLQEYDGQLCPEEFLDGERFAFIKGHPKLLGSPYKFQRHGKNGTWVSELLPHIASVVDDLTILKSVHTDQFNHAPAQMFLYTGSAIPGRPAMGSWLTYGLGAEASDLPGFVVLVSGQTPDAGKSVWGSGFLPSVFQGVQCRTSGDPVLYVSNPPGMDRPMRRRTLDALRDLNEMQHAQFGDPETVTRIAQYEMAFRMQVSVPDVMDISKEPQDVQEMYGAKPGQAVFANNCLLARRLVERGVRFVQLFDWGWDTHGTGPTDDLITQLPRKCKQVDQPVAALIRDLKQRGMLDDTLVIWSGEFGRTPMNEERNGSKYLGRDHHPHCFTMFMAGGGLKPGITYGETDDLGYSITEKPLHVHDLQATILHLLGIQHEQLTFRYQGRDFRLTDVFGEVCHDIIA